MEEKHVHEITMNIQGQEITVKVEDRGFGSKTSRKEMMEESLMEIIKPHYPEVESGRFLEKNELENEAKKNLGEDFDFNKIDKFEVEVNVQVHFSSISGYSSVSMVDDSISSGRLSYVFDDFCEYFGTEQILHGETDNLEIQKAIGEENIKFLIDHDIDFIFNGEKVDLLSNESQQLFFGEDYDT